jgi:hypothetical protein
MHGDDFVGNDSVGDLQFGQCLAKDVPNSNDPEGYRVETALAR